MDIRSLNWKFLERIRAGFLDGSAAGGPYWTSVEDLASYDASFGERIGWKWDAVLRELARLNWSPGSRRILDWGCGSGVAGRRIVKAFGIDRFDHLDLWDHSPIARTFAASQAREAFPTLTIEESISNSPGLLLVSHVLNELSPAAREDLLALARKADEILWVEPGTHTDSRNLSRIRDELLPNFHPVAPCPHSQNCPVLADQNSRHWCHFFAEPPPGIHCDSDWVRFSRLAGIDLRSLPFSFLALSKAPSKPIPPGCSRIIGRPKIFKGFARIFSCGPTGTHSLELQKREAPDIFKSLARETEFPPFLWQLDKHRIQSPLPHSTPAHT